MDQARSIRNEKINSRLRSIPGPVTCAMVLLLAACAGIAGCTAAIPTVKQDPAPAIATFSASPAAITAGAGTALSWATSGATSVAITPGSFASTSASGSVPLSPTTTTTYTLTATNSTGSTTATATVTVTQPNLPAIGSFTASPASIALGGISTLSWATTGAATITITPGTFTSASASGTTNVSPEATTTYVLTATNAAGSATATAMVTVAAAGGTLKITTTSCPGGTQGTAYAGCTIAASGGTPPYTFSVEDSASYPPLTEGMALDGPTGIITSPLIGGQGTYTPEIVVTDSTGAQATANISFAISGSNAFLGEYLSFGLDLSPSRGCGDVGFAGGYFAGGGNLQWLPVVDDQAVLRRRRLREFSERDSCD